MEKITPEQIKVLIIDDLEDNRELLRMDLEDEIEDIIVDQAANGYEGLDMLAKNEYSIVICDMMMPGMDGSAVLEESRKIRKNSEVPFVFLSANKQKEAAETALRAGAIDFLTKPYELIELIYKVKNLSRIKHLYSSLRASKKELEKVNKNLKTVNSEKDEVLRIVSHDMRSPLSSIIGLANVIKDGDYDSIEEVQEMASMIEKSGENMLQLINSLLDVARLESGRIKIEKQVVSLHSMFHQVLDSMEMLAKRKQLNFDISIPEKDVQVFVDVPKMQQIISNLVSNAIKFTKPGGNVNVTSGIRNDRDLFIRISDDGIGIKKEMIGEVFKKFGRYQRSGTAEEKGTGLGLSIVKRFVELHDGNIDVDSEVGKGTSFTILIHNAVSKSGKE